jgi:heme/copper-type cytochrome/quinol oxidase subunit 2
MIASVRAVTPQQFTQWLAGKKQQIQQADDAAARSRQQDKSAATQGS